MDELVCLLTGLTILGGLIGFAIYGLIVFIKTSFGSSKRAAVTRNLANDVIATCHLLNHLYQQGELTRPEYVRTWRFLEQKFGALVDLPDSLAPHPQTTSGEVESGQRSVPATPLTGASSETPASTPRVGSATEYPDSAVTPSPVVQAGIVPPVKAAPGDRERWTESVPSGPADTSSTLGREPWDVPDEPDRPRRSWAEFFSVFMQEKNIRWGELASGLLIVGSAVGLVVSLRQELNRAIPYFPALLFLLITAAIHAAGAYTLKQWKLRKTSRGTLLIGLFLVPLNFLAACLLRSGASSGDAWPRPSYWVAVSVGLLAYGALVWYSSRLLLRRGQWPLWAGVMGSAVAMLAFNRVDFSAATPLWFLAIGLGLAAILTIGSLIWWPPISQHRRWSELTFNRVAITFGLTWFAVATAVALVVVRSPAKEIAATALTPLAVWAGILLVWVGTMASTGLQRSDRRTLVLVARSMAILGWMIMAMGTAVSYALPVASLAAAVLVALGCGLMAQRFHMLAARAVSWSGVGLAACIGVNLWMKTLPWDGWGSPAAWREALFSGQAGIALMATAGLAAVVNWRRPIRVGGASSAPSLPTDWGWLPVAILAGAGCLLALTGGVLHRDDLFDTSTASVILGLGWLGALGAGARIQHRATVHVAAWAGYAFGAFTCLWNPVTGGWIEHQIPVWGGNALVMFAAHALISGLAGLLLRGSDARTRIDDLSMYVFASTGIALALAYPIATSGTGFACGLALASGVGCLGVARGIAQCGSRIDGGAVVKIVSLLALSITLLDHAERWNLPAWTTPSHWMFQAIAVAGWVLVAVSLETRFSNQDPGRRVWWLGKRDTRLNTAVLWSGLAGGLGLVGLGLGEACARQLVAGFDGLEWSVTGASSASAGVALAWLAATWWADRVAVSPVRRAALATAWLFVWAVPALWADPLRAAGTALRWSLSLGAAVTALTTWLRRALDHTADRQHELAAQPEGDGAAVSLDGIRERTRRVGVDTFLLGVIVGLVVVTTATIARVMLAADPTQALGGPLAGSFWLRLPVEVSYGVPIALLTVALLVFSITERRSGLAMVGSSIYQYAVLLVLVLLIWSPHPQLATRWFLNIVQAISIGMSLYGFGWYAARHRIHRAVGTRPDESRRAIHFDWHVGFNAILVTGLAVLVGVWLWFHPLTSGGWVMAVGDAGGLVAAILAAGLVSLYVKDRFAVTDRRSAVPAVVAWAGLVLLFFVAAWTNRNGSGDSEWAFQVIAWGGVFVSAIVCSTLMMWQHMSPVGTNEETEAGGLARGLGRAAWISIPIWASALIPLSFGIVGASHYSANPSFASAAFALAVVTTVGGIAANRVSTAYVSAIAVSLAAGMLFRLYPGLWLSARLPGVIHLAIAGWAGIAVAWVVSDLRLGRSAKRILPQMLYVDGVMAVTGLWCAGSAVGQWLVSLDRNVLGGADFVFNVWGAVFWVAALGMQIVSLWHPHVRVRVASRFLLTQGLLVLVVAVALRYAADRPGMDGGLSVLWLLFAWASNVTLWGVVWLVRRAWMKAMSRWRMPAVESLAHSMLIQLPIYGILTAIPVVWMAMIVMGNVADSWTRYLAALNPGVIALGLACLAGSSAHRWLQWLAMALTTFTAMLMSWADLPPLDHGQDLARWWLRGTLVLTGAMFLFGAVIPQWVRSSDRWLKSLREASVVVCGLAFVGMVGLVVTEFLRFEPDSGSRIPVSEALAIVGVGTGMVVGLILIAVRPRLDPFALSDRLRTAYVYVAQATTVLVFLHAYLSMPWIFQLGIMKYWPYLLMGLAFGGIGLAEVLRRRELTVLGDPIFNTAAVLPVLVSGALWSIESAADTSLVLLAGGLAYLMISYVRQSVTSGLLSIVLGNLALWMFYQRYPGLAFFEHPQLWLVPPALSALIAGHLSRDRLTPTQLVTLRYVCVGAIYVSSTAEIFIRGIGTALWPPVVLAALSVAGMFAGMLFHVRGYLYFGALFLLMAMVGMVSHAHQRLGHVWPWWAFGIVLGAAILVMFGLFEKRRNRLKGIADELRRWDL